MRVHDTLTHFAEIHVCLIAKIKVAVTKSKCLTKLVPLTILYRAIAEVSTKPKTVHPQHKTNRRTVIVPAPLPYTFFS